MGCSSPIAERAAAAAIDHLSGNPERGLPDRIGGVEPMFRVGVEGYAVLPDAVSVIPSWSSTSLGFNVPVFSRFSRYILEVARTGSIRSAADRLHIAPSAVDRQIINAEQELGTPLFDRLPQGMRLTSAGEHLVYNLRRWQQEYENVRTQIDSLQGLQGGRVNLAVPEALAGDFLANVLADFHEAYPRITYSVHAVGARGVREMVLSGNADLGLTFMSPGYRVLRLEHSVTLPPGLVVRADHPLAERTSIRLSDCGELPVIMPDDQMQIRGNLDRALAAVGGGLHCIAYVNNFAAMRALIRRGVGAGILTPAEAMAELQSGEFVFVRFADGQMAPSTLSLVTVSHPSVSASRLAERLVKTMNDMAGYGPAKTEVL